MQDIDSVPSKVQSANREALLYVFEDNESVIKMILKCRSPTMRHVSRTHRVALDCVEGIDLAPHFNEQFTIQKWLRMATTLRTPLRITTSRLSTMR